MFKPYEIQKTDAPITDPFSLDGFIDWLRNEDLSKKYNWSTCQTCVAGDYLRAIKHPGHLDVRTHGALFGDGYDSRCHPRYLEVTSVRPWTYGAALSRALALKARQS